MLVPPHRDLEIPVSCVERERWRYASKEFSSSPVIMERSLRARKAASVSASLRAGRSFASDQGEVWAGIRQMMDRRGMASPTEAMADPYAGEEESLRTFREAFACAEGQQGLAVVCGRRVLGLDFLSSPAAFRHCFHRLISSYAMELLDVPAAGGGGGVEGIHAFLTTAAAVSEEIVPSPGYGEDHRLRHEDLVGSALVAGNEVIHVGLFSLPPQTERPEMPALANYSCRRRFLARHGE
ncbi:MAG: DUF6569 family protein [Thermodesulfobacteriota bacterium]